MFCAKNDILYSFIDYNFSFVFCVFLVIYDEELYRISYEQN